MSAMASSTTTTTTVATAAEQQARQPGVTRTSHVVTEDTLNGTLRNPALLSFQPGDDDDGADDREKQVRPEHPIYGTTLYVGDGSIDTVYGVFQVLTFQDLIHKGYILALVKGDLSRTDVDVYTRLHSSCVTSETIGSLDCDCVQQLHGALEVIANKPCGVLFYLIQEGRGCGYVGKSRGCQLVQYHNDNISTFDAYAQLGMRKDYRTYRNIPDICHILGVRPRFVLLTNNPDKIDGLRHQGMDVVGVEAIEVPPNPWNQHYLVSKQQSGHLLMLVKNKVQTYTLPVPPCAPFVPYALPGAPRFVHAASYYLPIKPARSLLNWAEYEALGPLNLPYELSLDGDVLVEVRDPQLLETHAVLRRPYWFKVNVYYDIQTSSDWVVLEYRDCRTAASPRPPLVRIHSESIFARFPLTRQSYKRKYHDAIQHIVKNGCGLIVLMYHDGRGFGLGKYVLSAASAQSAKGQTQRQPSARHGGHKRSYHELEDEADVATSSNSSSSGTKREEGRDFAGAAVLLEHHAGNNPFVLMYSNNVSKAVYETHFPRVHDWIWIGDTDDAYGHQLLRRRNSMIAQLLNEPNHGVRILKPAETPAAAARQASPGGTSYVVTGIGSSEAHARFLVEQLKTVEGGRGGGGGGGGIQVKFVPIATPVSELDPKDKVIVFSQGFSPHTHEYIACAHVIFTSVTESNKDKDKVALLKAAIDRGANIVWFPLEDEYDVLIRLVGPFFGYVAVLHWVGKTAGIPTALDVSTWSLRLPPLEVSRCAARTGCLSILVPFAIMPYHQNIVAKWIEGVYFSPPFINDYLSWAHGALQAVAHDKHGGTDGIPHILFSTGVEPTQKIVDTLAGAAPIWSVPITHGIFEIEVTLNAWLLSLMARLRTNQRDWPGKQRQAPVYGSRY